jgi:hypothetical protein
MWESILTPPQPEQVAQLVRNADGQRAYEYGYSGTFTIRLEEEMQ